MPENVIPQPLKKNNSKFYLILSIIFVVVNLGIVAFLVLNSKKENNTQSSQTNNSENKPESTSNIVLENLGGINFGPYNASAKTSGDFIFSKDASNEAGPAEMLVFPFGQQVCSNANCKILPELGFHGLKLGTKVLAVSNGKIVEVKDQGVNDFAVSTVFENSNTALNYDHLSNVNLKIGDTIQADDALGEVAPYGSGTYGRFEIMLKEVGKDNKATYLCPMNYLDTSVKTKLTSDLKQFFADWNTFYGKTIHSATSYTGCLQDKLTEDEANS